MNIFRRPVLAWGIVILFAGGIWYGSSLSIGSESPFVFFGIDKLGHAIEFGILGLLVANALLTLPAMGIMLQGRELDTGAVWNGAVLISALWGWIDEIHQFWVPGRNTDPTDLLADIAGAAIGAWLLLRWMQPQSGRKEESTSPEANHG